MTVAVLYICTGRYSRFFADFYESAKKHFLKGIAEVEYFVFTDDDQISNSSDVHVIHKECQGFPLEAVFRFKNLLAAEDMTKGFDYIYFFNSNALFIKDVNLEILPPDNKTFIGSRWTKRKPFDLPMFFPYERNKKSTAYIPPKEETEYIYYMSGFYGAAHDTFFEKYHKLDINTQIDYNNGIIARFHDESHTNKYFRTVPCHLLPDGYCLPDAWANQAKDTHIIFRNKVCIDPYFDKNRDHSLLGWIKKGVYVLTNAFKWYL